MNRNENPRSDLPARQYHPFRAKAVEQYERQFVDTTPVLLPHWGRWRLVVAILAAIAAAAIWLSIAR